MGTHNAGICPALMRDYNCEERKAAGQLSFSMSLIKSLQFSHVRKSGSLWVRETLVFQWADFAFPAVPWAFRSKLDCGPQPAKHLDGSTPLSPWINLLNLLGLHLHFQETTCIAGLGPASLSCPHLCKGLSHPLKPY